MKRAAIIENGQVANNEMPLLPFKLNEGQGERKRESCRERWRKVLGEGLALAVAREKKGRQWENIHEQAIRDGETKTGILHFTVSPRLHFDLSLQNVG